jgi:hypothetical protein
MDVRRTNKNGRTKVSPFSFEQENALGQRLVPTIGIEPFPPSEIPQSRHPATPRYAADIRFDN